MAERMELNEWLSLKLQRQSASALFGDAWYLAYGCVCQSNMVDLDARKYEMRYIVPPYVLSFYRKDTGCTVN